MFTWITRWGKKSATFVEQILAAAIIVGVLVFSVFSAIYLAGMDWQDSMTFYELVYRTLLMVIGLEMARTLLTHDLKTILELLAFVVARKMLNPDITSIDIILSVASFVALLAAYRYFLVSAEPFGKTENERNP